MSFTNPYPASRLTVDTANSLANGLVGFWPLTDGGSSTTAKDITVNANDGTQSGGVSWASTTIGTAASFDGVNDRFSVSSFQGSSSGSVSFWAKTGLSGTISYAAFVSHGGDNAGVFEIGNYSTTTTLRWRLNFTGIADSGIAKLSGTISTTDWAFYTLAWDSTNWSGYVDGVQLFSEAHGLTAASITKDLYFATRRTTQTSGHMPGYIQNVRIYNRALSATEVATLYNRPWEGTNYGTLWPYSPPVPSSATLSTDAAATSLNVDLEGWWLATDNTGTTLVDISGNSVNGTISGTVGWDTTALGTAIEPDGSSGRADASVSLTGYPITMAAWFKTPSASAADECIMSVADSSVGTNQLRMIIENSTSKLEANGFDGTVVRAAASTTSVDDDEWHLGVAVFASSTSRKIYVDGVLEGTETSSQTMTAFDRASLAVTADSTPTAYFGGNIQNARLWSRALSADEVSLLYERPFEGITYGDTFHYDPPTPANLTPLTSDTINNSQIGWWPLTETDDYASGAADISGNANNGTQSGGVLSEVSRLGGVASFDGVNDIIDASAYTIASTSSMTMAGWIRYTSTVGSVSVLNICNAGGGTTAQYTRNIVINSSGNASCNVQSGTAIAQAVGSTVFDIGEWYFVVGTFDKVGTSYDVEIFVNGVSEATASGTGSELTPYTNTCIGGARRYNNAITAVEPCEIHNVRLWDRILTSDEIWSIYSNPWLGSAYSDAAAAVRFLINGFRNPLISGGLVR